MEEREEADMGEGFVEGVVEARLVVVGEGWVEV